MNPCLAGAIARPLIGGAAGSCPDYSTVTLTFSSDTYTAPIGDDAEMQFLPCPYEPPTVE